MVASNDAWKVSQCDGDQSELHFQILSSQEVLLVGTHKHVVCELKLGCRGMMDWRMDWRAPQIAKPAQLCSSTDRRYSDKNYQVFGMVHGVGEVFPPPT